MTQRIRYSKPGDVITAAHYNQVITGANSALEKLGPPSGRLTGTGSTPIETDDDLDGLGGSTYVETGRVSETVRISSPVDSTLYVDVERIRAVTLQSATDVLTLVFDW